MELKLGYRIPPQAFEKLRIHSMELKYLSSTISSSAPALRNPFNGIEIAVLA